MLASKNLVQFSPEKNVGLKRSKGFPHSSHIFLPKVFICNCDMSDKIYSHLSFSDLEKIGKGEIVPGERPLTVIGAS